MVIAYASRSLRLSQRRYCTTRREMLAAVVMCTHFRSYLRGAQFTLRTDHSSLRWLQKFHNEDAIAGTYCWASFRLPLNIVQGLNMPMRMACLDSVGSVGDRIVLFPLRIRWWPNYSTDHVYLHRPNTFGFWQLRLHLCYETLKCISNFSELA